MTTRNSWVHIHRYVGLAMTVFLIIVGLTGSVLAFYQELDRWLNPELLTVPVRDAPMLDPFVLRERAEALEPRIYVNYVNLHLQPGESYAVGFEPKTDPATGEPYVLPYDELFFDPYTGEKLGTRKQPYDWGEVALLDRKNWLLLIYALHEQLALPGVELEVIGTYVLGIVALCWALDCFIGFYLTLPAGRKKRAPLVHDALNNRNLLAKRTFWKRWRPAWGIKRSRFNYDLHRASGLWVWPMLLVLACSSMSFNLGSEVYFPAMKLFFDMPVMTTFHKELPALAQPLDTPRLGWREAHAQAQRLMQALATQHDFTVEYEEGLYLERGYGTYFYRVHSSADWGRMNPYATYIQFDANTGEIKQVYTPAMNDAGDTITLWLTWLHRADVFGLPMQIFVCTMGLIITALSVTGVVIWVRKRKVISDRRLRCSTQRSKSVHTGLNVKGALPVLDAGGERHGDR